MNVRFLDRRQSRDAAQRRGGWAELACDLRHPRDVAQYLAKIFGTRVGEGAAPMPAPVEALERAKDGEVLVRVRFSAGLCGDVSVPLDIRLKVLRRAAPTSWWKKIFGG